MFSITPLSFDAPSPGNSREYLYKPYTAIFGAERSIGLSSFNFSRATDVASRGKNERSELEIFLNELLG